MEVAKTAGKQLTGCRIGLAGGDLMSKRDTVLRSFFQAMHHRGGETEKRTIGEYVEPQQSPFLKLDLDREFAGILISLQDAWIEAEELHGFNLPNEITFNCQSYGSSVRIISETRQGEDIEEEIDASECEIAVSPSYMSLRTEDMSFDLDPEHVRAVAEGLPLPGEEECEASLASPR